MQVQESVNHHIRCILLTTLVGLGDPASVTAQDATSTSWACNATSRQAPAASVSTFSPCRLLTQPLPIQSLVRLQELTTTEEADSLAHGNIVVRSILGSAAGSSLGLIILNAGGVGSSECGYDDCISATAAVGALIVVIGPITGAAIGASSAGARTGRAIAGSLAGVLVGGLGAILINNTAGSVPALVSFPVIHGVVTAWIANHR